MTGHTDLPLSARGRGDFVALARSLVEPPARLVTSDLRRARESAAILAERWGIEPIVDSRLRELNFGEWEGHSWKEIEESDGERLGRWMRDWIHERTPGGESFTDLLERVWEWLDEWRQRRSSNGDTMVVAHAGSIRAMLCRLLKAAPEEAFAFQVAHARLISMTEESKCPLCGVENDCAVAAGRSVSACWCSGERIPADLVERISPERRGEACICSTCAGRRPS